MSPRPARPHMPQRTAHALAELLVKIVRDKATALHPDHVLEAYELLQSCGIPWPHPNPNEKSDAKE